MEDDFHSFQEKSYEKKSFLELPFKIFIKEVVYYGNFIKLFLMIEGKTESNLFLKIFLLKTQ